jgi:hypothetical protein
MNELRVIALWRDDPTEARLSVDMRIDATGRVRSVWDVFGAFDLDGPHCQPFILRRDGAIDFGASHNEKRQWRTNLRDAEIRVGAEFIIWWNDEDCGVYKIVKLAALGAKETHS